MGENKLIHYATGEMISGTNLKQFSIKRMSSKNPVILLIGVVDGICKSLVKSDFINGLKYMLACSLLNKVDFDENRLIPDIKNIKEIISSVTLKEVKNEA